MTEPVALREYFEQRFEDMNRLLDERYQTQTKAVDAAFLAQQTAMRTALEAANVAVQAALTSAEKAVAKAETAAEKRFDSQNEFRAQLSDQASTFLPREVAEAQFSELRKQIQSNTDRLNSMTGASTQAEKGVDQAQTKKDSNNRWIALGVTSVIAITSIIVTILLVVLL